MVSCTGCAHYTVCKEWHESNCDLVKTINTLRDIVCGIFEKPIVTSSEVDFPRVAETKEELCPHYSKAKML